MYTFFSNADTGGIGGLSGFTQEIFCLAREIKEMLGENGYLLEKYIRGVFACLSEMDIYKVSARASLLGSHFGEVLSSVEDGQEDYEWSELYARVREYIGDCPEDKEPQNQYIKLMDDFVKTELEKFRERLDIKLKRIVDNHNLAAVRQDICTAAGEERVNRLDDFINRRFSAVRPDAAFEQELSRVLIRAFL